MKTLTIDEALERLRGDTWPEGGPYDEPVEVDCAPSCLGGSLKWNEDIVRAILNDFARGQWEAAADALGEAEICDPIADKVRPQRARTVAYDILVLVHDAITTEAERRFPTTNPTQAGTMTDGPCGTCGGSRFKVISGSTNPGETIIGSRVEPCPDCKPSAPDNGK